MTTKTAKKSFILHWDSLDVLEELSDQQAGQLFKAIKELRFNPDYKIVCNVNNIFDGLLNAVFITFKNQIKRDTEKYENVCVKNKANILKRWNKKDTKNTTGKNRIPKHTKHTDNDSDSGTDNGTVNDNKNGTDNVNKNDSIKTLGSKTSPLQKDFIGELIFMFSNLYFQYRNIEYIADGKDRGAAGKLLGKYKSQSKNKGKTKDECLNDFDRFFTECLNIKNTWYYQNMTLSIINSKINEIGNILRKRTKSGLDDPAFLRIISEF